MQKTKKANLNESIVLIVTAERLAELLNCGRATAVKIGIDSGAKIQIGWRTLYKVSRERFEKEFLRAGNDGCKIYLMVEVKGGYSDIISHNYKTEFAPAAFVASLRTWESRFGCNVQFIDSQYAGHFIFSVFEHFAREALK